MFILKEKGTRNNSSISGSAFHTYSIVWNPKRIIFLVGNGPIRVFQNHEAIGVPFPSPLSNTRFMPASGMPMTGQHKVGALRQTGSPPTIGISTLMGVPSHWDHLVVLLRPQILQTRNRGGLVNLMLWVQSKHMVYNYCTDSQRFPRGLPVECKSSRFVYNYCTDSQRFPRCLPVECKSSRFL